MSTRRLLLGFVAVFAALQGIAKEGGRWEMEPRISDWRHKERKSEEKAAPKIAVVATTPVAKKPSPLNAVAPGMTADQVRALVGGPKSKTSEFWSYADGYVEFSATNRVTRVRLNETTPDTNRVKVSVTGLAPSGYADYSDSFYTPSASTASSSSDVWVDGYTRSDGTYVQGHHRTAPNGTTADNYSTRGNVNPYTGERGTKRP